MLSLFVALALAEPAATAPCTPEASVPATVMEIQARPDQFLDRCVTVSGFFADIDMVGSREGAYLVSRFGRDGNREAANRIHKVGIDSSSMRELRMRFPQWTTVTGRVDSCERRAQRIVAAGGFPFLGGYCHYEYGPTIVVNHYAITERRIERMVGENARQRFGNLVPMPSNWPHRARAETVAAEFLRALAAGDQRKLTVLHEPRDKLERQVQKLFDEVDNRSVELIFTLLEDSESPFAQFRSVSAPQTAIFVSAASDGTPLAGSSAVICFCRTSDCADRWPITLNDANNETDRPYACTQAERLGDRAGPVLNTPLRGGWTVEPRRTAFRS